MSLKKPVVILGLSCFFGLSLLLADPSRALFTDAIRPPDKSSGDVRAEGYSIPSGQFKISDPSSIIVPQNLGRIKEFFKGDSKKIVINIQDAHCNFEAQSNISNILEGLNKDYGLELVALEGSAGDIDPSLFTTFPDEDIRKEVAVYFLKKGKINGAEYLAITSKNPPKLYGVETREYYLANLASFINIQDGRQKAKAACEQVRDTLERLKGYTYSKALKNLDAKIADYKAERIGIIDYCGYLREAGGLDETPFDSERFSNLALFCRTADIEKTIDFNKVDTERDELLAALEKILSQNEISALISKSQDLKSDQISAAKYYIYLTGLAQSKGISFGNYPNLKKYSEYLDIYEKVNNAALLKEMAVLEGLVKDRLFENNDQRLLDKLSTNIRLLDNMFDIAMSREDMEYYKINKADFRSAAFSDFIKAQSARYNLNLRCDENLSIIDKYLPDLENFYRVADARDDVMIDNTIKKMDEDNVPVAALVAGGYHTEGITERLRKRGISYVIVVPRITKPDADNPYLSILADEKISAAGNINPGTKNLAITSMNEKSPTLPARSRAELNQAAQEMLKRVEASRPNDAGKVVEQWSSAIQARAPNSIGASVVMDLVAAHERLAMAGAGEQSPIITSADQLRGMPEVSVGDGVTINSEGPAAGIKRIGKNVKFENGATLTIKSGWLDIGDNVTIKGNVVIDGDIHVGDGAALDGTMLKSGEVVYFTPQTQTFARRQEEMISAFRDYALENPNASLSARMRVAGILLMANFWGLRGSPADLILPVSEMLGKDINPSLDIAEFTRRFHRSLAAARGSCPACGSMVSQFLLSERFDIQPDVASEAFEMLMMIADAADNKGDVLKDPKTGEVLNSAWALGQVLDYKGFECDPGTLISTLTSAGLLKQDQAPVVVHAEKRGTDGRYYPHWVYVKQVDGRVYVVDNGEAVLLVEFVKNARFTGVFLAAAHNSVNVPKKFDLTESAMKNIRGACALSGVSARSATLEGAMYWTSKDPATMTRVEMSDFLAASVEKFTNLDLFSGNVIGRLEPRGYDNYSDAHKFVIPLKKGVQLPAELMKVIAEGEKNNTQDIAVLRDERGEPYAIRFFAISRGVGATSANQQQIAENIKSRVREVVQLLYGKGAEPQYNTATGNWKIVSQTNMRGYTRGQILGAVIQEANPRHTRFKTKGGDRKENAHFWVWKGFSLGHNGDFETYNIFRPIFEEILKETFEGTTDSEVLLHVVGDMSEEKDEGGKVLSRSDSVTATKRAFRLIENVEALMRAADVLRSDRYDEKVKEAVRDGLRASGIPIPVDALVDKLKTTQRVGTQMIPIYVLEFITNAVKNPLSFDFPIDPNNPYGYIALEKGGKTVGLGEYLRDAKNMEPAAGVFAKGLTIAIEVMSLYDDENIVAARTHADSTSLYLGVEPQAGERGRVFLASETKGFAPEIGVREEYVDVADGILRITRGSVSQVPVTPWTIVSVKGNTIQRAETFTQKVEQNPEPERIYVSWKEILKPEEYAKKPAFVWEATLQATTVGFTLNALTKYDKDIGGFRLDLMAITDDEMIKMLEEDQTLPSTIRLATAGKPAITKDDLIAFIKSNDRKTVSDLLSHDLQVFKQTCFSDPTWDPIMRQGFENIFYALKKWLLREGISKEAGDRLDSSPMCVVGTGTSENAARFVDAQGNYFDYVESSDAAKMALPPFLKKGATLVIVSQSGETGVAKIIAEQAIRKGCKIITITNRRGSSLYAKGIESGGVIVTESIDEDAVAATGSNSCQIVALRLLGLFREQLRAVKQKRASEGDARARTSRRISNLYALATHVNAQGTQEIGAMQQVYERFAPGGENYIELERSGILPFLEQSFGGSPADRANGKEMTPGRIGLPGGNIYITGFGAVANKQIHEGELKITEISRDMVRSAPISRLLASGAGDSDPLRKPVPADADSASATLEANLKLYTNGVGETIGKAPSFKQLPDNDQTNGILNGAPEIMLLGDGEDAFTLNYLQEKYKAVSNAAIRGFDYHDRIPEAKKGALVIALQPWTQEQKEILEKLRSQGAVIFIVKNETPQADNRIIEENVTKRAKDENRLIETAGTDSIIAQTAVLDLFLAQVMAVRGEKSGPVDYTDPLTLESEVSQMAKQVSGIKEVAKSFTKPESGAADVVTNYYELQRLKQSAEYRGAQQHIGWGVMDLWATGKGPFTALAHDFSNLATTYTGKISVSEESSNYSHGWYGALRKGGVMMFVQYPGKGMVGADDVKKKAVDETLPRANYPYPIFKKQEPSLLISIAREDKNDPMASHLSSDEFRALRTKRRQAIDTEDTRRPDVVLTVPNGGLFERYCVNRIVVNELQKAQATARDGAEARWDSFHPNNVVIVFDSGEAFVGKDQMYHDLRSRFSQRNRSKIVVIAPQDVMIPAGCADLTLRTSPSRDPLLMVPVAHALTGWIANHRFRKSSQFLMEAAAAFADDMKKPEKDGEGKPGSIMKRYPRYQTVGELFAAYGMDEKDAGTAISELQGRYPVFGNLSDKLLECIDVYNIDPFATVGIAAIATNIDFVISKLIDNPSNLAKVVTNPSGIMVAGSRPDPIRFASWDFSSASPLDIVTDTMKWSQLAADPDASRELRNIISETFGADKLAGVDNNMALGAKYLELAAPVLLNAQSTVRQWYPGLEANPKVVLELGSDRLAHREEDGVLALNVHAVRDPDLAAQQVEHELLHELLAGQLRDLKVPAELAAAADPEKIKNAMIELFILENEIKRFRGYPQDIRERITAVLKGENAVDPKQDFYMLLENYAASANDSIGRTAVILNYMIEHYPDIRGGAQAIKDQADESFIVDVFYMLHGVLAKARLTHPVEKDNRAVSEGI